MEESHLRDNAERKELLEQALTRIDDTGELLTRRGTWGVANEWQRSHPAI